ncbi:hypothetical protein [Cesiribacter sp. SM1]|uniref:hypothetical protein n=1 Tax=Cesiribacter sp. SM1 TaxID=2861196 RepID=UPI001CD73B7C|nr:hypothetical protein [Cesiribacter sp. SM1]
MRYLILIYLLIGQTFNLHAKEMFSKNETVFPVGEDAQSKEMFLIEKNGSIKAAITVGGKN